MINIAVFASGNGSNFQAIVESGIVVKLLVCNNLDAYVIKRAQSLNVPYIIVDSTKEYEKKLLNFLNQLEIDLIVLAGYMKILKESLLTNFTNRIINIHPSLLPNYKGKDAIKRAYLAKEKVVGVSVHYVDRTIDGGALIDFMKIDVHSMSYDELEKEVHRVEHVLYPRVIKKIIKELCNEKSIDFS